MAKQKTLYYADGSTVIDIGDRCHVTKEVSDSPPVGTAGTIVELQANDEMVVVEFDDWHTDQWYTFVEALAYGEPDDADEDEEADEEAETPLRYAVGDTVRLTVRGDYQGDAQTGPRVGDVGTVTKILYEDCAEHGFKRYKGEQLLAVRFETYGPWNVNSGRIEAVQKEETVADTTKATAKDLAKGVAPTIERTGRQIILPEGMTLRAAQEWLKRREAEEETVVEVRHEFVGAYPTDALVAVSRAMADIYNWVANVPTPGWFGPEPPTMVTVRTGPGTADFLNVPLGRMAIPGMKGFIQTAIGGPKGKQPSCWITGQVRQGDMPQVKEIIAKAQDRLLSSSIYRGKAIKVSWRWLREGEAFDLGKNSPQFMDLSESRDSGLVFSQDVQQAIEQGLYTPIEHTQACRDNSIPLKRGVLMAGPPGTGKTLTALVTAGKAVDNGWGFIYLEDVQDLRHGLALARMYGRSVVFAEDIDRVVSGERDASMDEILNCLDGVDSKGQETIVVLTSNHVERIIRPVLRPGRVDTLIETKAPDAEAAARLIRLYARDLLSSDADVAGVGAMLDGQIPAVIREVVERAKLAAIHRLKGHPIKGKVMHGDLEAAAASLQAHARLLDEKPDMPIRTTLEIPLTYVNESIKA